MIIAILALGFMLYHKHDEVLKARTELLEWQKMSRCYKDEVSAWWIIRAGVLSQAYGHLEFFLIKSGFHQRQEQPVNQAIRKRGDQPFFVLWASFIHPSPPKSVKLFAEYSGMARLWDVLLVLIAIWCHLQIWKVNWASFHKNIPRFENYYVLSCNIGISNLHLAQSRLMMRVFGRHSKPIQHQLDMNFKIMINKLILMVTNCFWLQVDKFANETLSANILSHCPTAFKAIESGRCKPVRRTVCL